MKQRLPNLIKARGLTEPGFNPIKANLYPCLACDVNFDHPITNDLNENYVPTKSFRIYFVVLV